MQADRSDIFIINFKILIFLVIHSNNKHIEFWSVVKSKIVFFRYSGSFKIANCKNEKADFNKSTNHKASQLRIYFKL